MTTLDAGLTTELVVDRPLPAVSVLRRLSAAFQAWRARRRQMKILRQLPDAVLIDIGVDPKSIWSDRYELGRNPYGINPHLSRWP